MGSFLFQRLLDILFPIECIGCSKIGDLICSTCNESIELNPQWVQREQISIYTLYDYQKKLHAKLVEAWKYHGSQSIIDKLLIDSNLNLDIDLIIPIPLHKKRVIERGFDPPLEIAKELSKQIHRPVSQLLTRKKYTQQQARLDQQDRRENMKDCFELFEEKNIQGKKILLVDDIVTSGSTLLEATRILNTAESVNGFCLMRSELRNKKQSRSNSG